ncbi:MFS general substrate transporter [Myriangium duriaei CBS 260.36]|uniref:MFS general substrate transporter n=1 Tax=Myriangium duriaei CBS 260.36 TaxID=1168546 RepID=A0A9P4IYL0_9PEZI|nr:MFS general substrate transporter [Myriangium duriaei CBS 260.36]
MTPIEKSHPIQSVSFPPVTPTWSNMPCKPQLAILCLSRFVDFFQMASLQTYMVHQLKSFNPELSDSVISHQAGVLQGSFTAAQIVTSILWGRLADKPNVGRKLVLNIGLIGTGISMLGVGFATTYTQAVVWRVLGGAINGTVGAARTMVAETVDKRWHPRAFLLLPAAFNIANVAGPILGGLLVEPVNSFPGLFGENSTFGGRDGVAWMKNYPYAVANMLSTILLFAEALLVTYGLKETLRGYKGAEWGAWSFKKVLDLIIESFQGVKAKGVRAMTESNMLKRGLLSGREDSSVELNRLADNQERLLSENEKGQSRPPPRLPFSRIWTSNVLWTLASVAIFDFHMGAFNNLWILFLSTSREFVPTDSSMPQQQHEKGSEYQHLRLRSASPFKFSGGLAFPPPTIGFAMAILGFIGVALQFLLYPWANGKFGLMRCFRASLFLFPLAYFLAPYISLLPSTTAFPEPAAGFWVWTGIAMVLTLQVAARTFALPASIILVNNSSPHPSVLGTIHGLGQADSATFRTFGPILAGGWYGTWLERGVVGMAWWIVAAISALGCFASFYVRNGSGHEIFLEGEEETSGGGIRRRDSVAAPSNRT